MDQNPQTPKSSRFTGDDSFRLDSSPQNYGEFNSTPDGGSYLSLLGSTPIQQQPLFATFSSSPNAFRRAAEEAPPSAEYTRHLNLQQLSQPNWNTESVPDTQPDAQPSSGAKKKTKKASKNKTRDAQEGRRKWLPEEEEILTRAWLTIATDPAVGTAQNEATFWNRVSDYFHAAQKKTKKDRNDDSLSSKWRTMKGYCRAFNDLVNKYSRQQASGSNERDKFFNAHQEYKINSGGKPFTHEHVWAILKDQPGWVWQPDPIANLRPSKRAKSSSTNENIDSSSHGSQRRANIDLNEEIPEPVVRPMGRDKAKQAASGSGSRSSHASDFSFLEASMQSNHETQSKKLALRESRYILEQEKLEMKKEELAAKKKDAEANLMRSDLEVMTLNPDNFSGIQKETIAKMQKRVYDRYKDE